MITFNGKGGSSAKVLADSISADGHRMTSFEIEIPKVLLAENNTHRSQSRNFSSSRAVPVNQFNQIPSFEPVYYGKNQAGMVAKKEEVDSIEQVRQLWLELIEQCKAGAAKLSELGLHKQWSNRPNDWHSIARGVISATDWDNMLWLRRDEEAQPEFDELAKCIQSCFDASVPNQLAYGEWHLPYIDMYRDDVGVLHYVDSDGQELSIELAQKISASCCAQVSYRRLNDSREKALEIYDKLFSGRKPHLSPTEHIATPIITTLDVMDERNVPFESDTWEAGVTHVDRNGILHSGNLTGWIQYRQMLPNNVFKKM